MDKPHDMPPSDAPTKKTEVLFGVAGWSKKGRTLLTFEGAMGPQGVSPLRFIVSEVREPGFGHAELVEVQRFEVDQRWPKIAERLMRAGFAVKATKPILNPPTNVFTGGPTPSSKADEQTVRLKNRAGDVWEFTRKRKGGEWAAKAWDKPAVAFPSPDGRFVYVLPDRVLVPVGAAA